MSSDEYLGFWQDIENKVRLVGDNVISKEWKNYIDKAEYPDSYQHILNIANRIRQLQEREKEGLTDNEKVILMEVLKSQGW